MGRGNRSSFENSDIAGQIQFLTTLKASQWSANTYLELNPGFVQLRAEQEEAFRNRPDLTAPQLALIPSASERSTTKYLQNKILQKVRGKN